MTPAFRDPWHDRGGETSTTPFWARRAPMPSGRRNRWPWLVGLVVVAALAFVAFPFAGPMFRQALSNRTAQAAAHEMLDSIPAKVGREQELHDALRAAIDARLGKPDVAAIRWFVGYGRHGEEPVAVRDDDFGRTERAFVDRLVTEGRLVDETAGRRADVFTWPLGAMYQNVVVGRATRCVLVGWRLPDRRDAAPAPSPAR